MLMFDCIVVGGGASGVFAAIQAKDADPSSRILLVEKGPKLLSKVLCTGGGRCNVTNACFEAFDLISHYPRGAKELLGPFHRFGPREMMSYLESRKVSLKVEAGQRVFPTSDQSETIVDLLEKELHRKKVEVRCEVDIEKITHENGTYRLENTALETPSLIIATGGNSAGYKWAEELGHTIITPVPSLFALKLKNNPLKALSGVCCESVQVRIGDFAQEGSLLITHFGLTGPAVLKLSSQAARRLHEQKYQADIEINWLPLLKEDQIFEKLILMKQAAPKKLFATQNPFSFSKSLWAIFSENKRWGELSQKKLREVAKKLCHDRYAVNGRSVHKEEFVTCGGVCLKEVDFKTMESKICPNLYFAGEILDIDGFTGGFNLQNAWTTGYLAGRASVSSLLRIG